MALVKKKPVAKKEVELKPDSTVKVILQDATREYMQKTDPYASQNFRFALASKIVKGTTKQLTGLIGCRDGFMGQIKRHYNGENPLSDYSTDKTTILAFANPGTRTKYEEWLNKTVATSLALVNHFEKECGWFRTKAFEANIGTASKAKIIVFQGSKWWSTAPMTMSLYLLLLRLGRRTDIQALGKTFTTKQLIDALKNATSNKNGPDNYYLQNVHKWPVLLKNRAKIFGKRKFATNFTTAAAVDGIMRLSSNETNDQTIQKRFNEFCKG